MIDVATGEVVGIHYAGIYLKTNLGVPAAEVIRDLTDTLEGIVPQSFSPPHTTDTAAETADQVELPASRQATTPEEQAPPVATIPSDRPALSAGLACLAPRRMAERRRAEPGPRRHGRACGRAVMDGAVSGRLDRHRVSDRRPAGPDRIVRRPGLRHRQRSEARSKTATRPASTSPMPRGGTRLAIVRDRRQVHPPLLPRRAARARPDACRCDSAGTGLAAACRSVRPTCGPRLL